MKIKFFLASLFFLSFFIAPAAVSAQESAIFKQVCKHNRQEINKNGINEEPSTVCEDAAQGSNANPLYGPRGIIGIVVNLLSLVVGIAAVVGIMVAAIKYLTSASNPEEANKARELIIYAVVGLALAVLAQVLVRAVLYNELYT